MNDNSWENEYRARVRAELSEQQDDHGDAANWEDNFREEVRAKLTGQAPARAANKPTQNDGGLIRDTALALGSGTTHLVGSAAWLADTRVSPLHYINEGIEYATDVDILGGIQDSAHEASEYLNSQKSTKLQEKINEISSIEGGWNTFKAAITEPRFIADLVATSIPSLIPVGVAARVAHAAKGANAAVKAALVAEAIVEGADGGSEEQRNALGRMLAMPPEQLQQNASGYASLINDGASHEEAVESIARNSGETAAVITAGISLLAGKITGAAKIEADWFTGNGIGDLTAALAKEIPEEILQEGGNAFGGNVGEKLFYNPEVGLMEGVPEQAALGAVGAIGQTAGMKVTGGTIRKVGNKVLDSVNESGSDTNTATTPDAGPATTQAEEVTEFTPGRGDFLNVSNQLAEAIRAADADTSNAILNYVFESQGAERARQVEEAAREILEQPASEETTPENTEVVEQLIDGTPVEQEETEPTLRPLPKQLSEINELLATSTIEANKQFRGKKGGLRNRPVAVRGEHADTVHAAAANLLNDVQTSGVPVSPELLAELTDLLENPKARPVKPRISLKSVRAGKKHLFGNPKRTSNKQIDHFLSEVTRLRRKILQEYSANADSVQQNAATNISEQDGVADGAVANFGLAVVLEQVKQSGETTDSKTITDALTRIVEKVSGGLPLVDAVNEIESPAVRSSVLAAHNDARSRLSQAPDLVNTIQLAATPEVDGSDALTKANKGVRNPTSRAKHFKQVATGNKFPTAKDLRKVIPQLDNVPDEDIDSLIIAITSQVGRSELPDTSKLAYDAVSEFYVNSVNDRSAGSLAQRANAISKEGTKQTKKRGKRVRGAGASNDRVSDIVSTDSVKLLKALLEKTPAKWKKYKSLVEDYITTPDATPAAIKAYLKHVIKYKNTDDVITALKEAKNAANQQKAIKRDQQRDDLAIEEITAIEEQMAADSGTSVDYRDVATGSVDPNTIDGYVPTASEDSSKEINDSLYKEESVVASALAEDESAQAWLKANGMEELPDSITETTVQENIEIEQEYSSSDQIYDPWNVDEILKESGSNNPVSALGTDGKYIAQGRKRASLYLADVLSKNPQGKDGIALLDEVANLLDKGDPLYHTAETLLGNKVLREIKTPVAMRHVDGSTAVGRYEPDTHKVLLDTAFVERTLKTKSSTDLAIDPVTVLVHELVHAVTVAGLTSNNKYARELDGMMVHAIEYLEKRAETDPVAKELLELYGFTNLHEFVAEAMTDITLQQLLASIPYKSKTIWNSFMEAVARLFSTHKEDNLLSAVFETIQKIEPTRSDIQGLSNLMQAYDQEKAGDALYEGTRDLIVKRYLSYKNGNYDAGVTYETLITDLLTDGDINASTGQVLLDAFNGLGDGPVGIRAQRQFIKQANSVLAGKQPLHKRRDEKLIRKISSIDSQMGAAAEHITNTFSPLPGKGSFGPSYSAVSNTTKKHMLGWMTLDAIETEFSKLFAGVHDRTKGVVEKYGRGFDPMKAYIRELFKEQAEARKLEREADKIATDWANFERQHTAEEVKAFRDLIEEATITGVHPDVAFTDPLNAHLAKKSKKGGLTTKGQTNQKLHDRLAAQWDALPKQAREVYKKSRNFYKDIAIQQRDLVITNMLELYEVDAIPKLKERILNANNPKELADIPPPMVVRGGQVVPLPSWGKIVKSFTPLVQLANTPGPYFPIKRFGEFAVEYSKEQVFGGYSSKAAAQKAAMELRAEANINTAEYEQSENGQWSFKAKVNGFSLYETLDEANDIVSQMASKGYKVNGPTEKANWAPDSPTDIGMVLRNASSKLDGTSVVDQQAQTALREALIQLLPETSLQKHMLKRDGVAGAGNSEGGMDSRRIFAGYVQTAGWNLASLKHRKNISDYYRLMMTAGEEASRNGVAGDKLLRISQVANELAKRRSQGSIQVGKFGQVTAKFGFMWFLMSVSYSMVNATQPVLMTIPFLSGKYGNAKAIGALGRAYSDVGGTITKSLVESWGGVKAIKGKVDLNDVVNIIIKNLNAQGKTDQARMIKELADSGKIDTTFALEISEAAKSGNDSTAGKVTDKVVEVGRVMPFTVELMNRATTALAAYELAISDSTHNHDSATEFASQAVVKTQFDYTTLNRPRHFVHNDMVRAMTMFKIHPISMYTFMIHNVRQWLGEVGATKEQKVEARRSLRTFFMVHAAVVGGSGALLLEPIKAALGLLSMAFGDIGDEDDDWMTNPEFAMRRATYDMAGMFADDPEIRDLLARVATRGPAELVGVNLVPRIGLQNMLVQYSQGDNPVSTVLGTIVQSAIGPILGQKESINRAFNHLAEGGDLSKSFEYIAPKMLRDIMKAGRYEESGMTDFRGAVIAKPEQFSSLELAGKIIGFGTTTESDVYLNRGYYQGIKRTFEKRKRKLKRQIVDGTLSGADIGREIRAFNRSLPRDMRRYSLSYSDVIKSKQARRTRERDTRDGVYQDKKDRLFGRRLIETN